MLVWVAAFASLVACASTQFYVNNSSSVAVLLAWSEASWELFWAPLRFEARSESCTRLDLELVLNCFASAGDVLVDVLSCSNVEVVAWAKALLANQMCASSKLKVVYDVLVFQRSVLSLSPMFGCAILGQFVTFR
ncbi:MAG: hypothetical protein P3M75_00215 [Candidatus Hodgkinia cicadicola]|nr:MAG: hypothetical protein P3M75_00215 [Candidatus Hodgkinia cicadicola]